jgi:predicted nucleic acid-binding protein
LTRYLLDTKVISNIRKPDPSESLLEWMGAQPIDKEPEACGQRSAAGDSVVIT